MTIKRHHIIRWLNQQPTTEVAEHPDGLVCVDLTHGWAVMVMSKHGAGPHTNVLLSDLERALHMSRTEILEAVACNLTIRQIQFKQRSTT